MKIDQTLSSPSGGSGAKRGPGESGPKRPVRAAGPDDPPGNVVAKAAAWLRENL